MVVRGVIYASAFLFAIAAIVGLGALLAHTHVIQSSFLLSLTPKTSLAAVWMATCSVAAIVLLAHACLAKKRNDSFNTSSPIGGVENAGNTCYISVVLQQLAAEPTLFSAEGNTPLDWCVRKIRGGRTVTRSDMRELHASLAQEGWRERLGATGDSVELFTWILVKHSHLYVSQVTKWTSQKINIGGDNFRMIKRRPTEDDQLLTSVWVREGRIGGRVFHWVIYRNIEGRWFRCSDSSITEVKRLPSHGVDQFAFYTIHKPETAD